MAEMTRRSGLSRTLAAGLALLAAAFPAAAAPDSAVRVEVDWPAFLARHDMVWEQLPRQWNEGAFAGNGQLGMMVYGTLDDNRVDSISAAPT